MAERLFLKKLKVGILIESKVRQLQYMNYVLEENITIYMYGKCQIEMHMLLVKQVLK